MPFTSEVMTKSSIDIVTLKARHDSRHNRGDNHFEKGLLFVRAEVVARFDNRVVEFVNAGRKSCAR